MNKPMAVQSAGRTIGRPLKVLIPLIQSELFQGNEIGREHYRRAGNMLIEAKDQVSHGRWGQWLTKNFDLSQQTARVYMKWAREYGENARGERDPPYRSLREMRGDTERRREEHQSKQQQDFRRVLRDVARDSFVQERQARDDEVKLHREMAEELVEIGFRAMALKLHPDRGGAKIAMSRLNCVHDDLKRYVQTRRFGG